jgi:hypothetical protein
MLTLVVAIGLEPTGPGSSRFSDVRERSEFGVVAPPRNDSYKETFSSFCRHRARLTSAGIASSGKLVFQSVTPTSPT